MLSPDQKKLIFKNYNILYLGCDWNQKNLIFKNQITGLRFAQKNLIFKNKENMSATSQSQNLDNGQSKKTDNKK